MLLHALLICNALGYLDEISIFVEFKELLVAVFSKTRLDQASQNDFDLVYCLLVNNWIDLVSDISDVLGCRGHAVSPPNVLKVQRLTRVLPPLRNSVFQDFTLIKISLELIIIQRAELLHKPSDFLLRPLQRVFEKYIVHVHHLTRIARFVESVVVEGFLGFYHAGEVC